MFDIAIDVSRIASAPRSVESTRERTHPALV
jgi:hypothetical protein